MKIAYLDFWTGLGGDMLVGALLDAGWPEERLFAVVRALKLGPTEVTVERRTQRGMTGLGIRVRANHDPHERHLHEIEALIGAADLPAPAKAAAIRTFRALGEVEARVHGIPIEQVHFHEIGAADSIVDIVAAAVALHDLGVERLEAGVIPMTTGFVEMDHGRLPVPAPATALLLAGWPLRPVAIEGVLHPDRRRPDRHPGTPPRLAPGHDGGAGWLRRRYPAPSRVAEPRPAVDRRGRRPRCGRRPGRGGGA
ncbi:MAG: LarC family nickel insertion protein [Candidatus Eisenbacteria bacterium]|nr:LarC family nickel insertion protein [Candidatus Eisenbacteria bacterium]